MFLKQSTYLLLEAKTSSYFIACVKTRNSILSNYHVLQAQTLSWRTCFTIAIKTIQRTYHKTWWIHKGPSFPGNNFLKTNNIFAIIACVKRKTQSCQICAILQQTKISGSNLSTPLQAKLMILLCLPEKYTQFHYPLDPKKIRAEGSMRKDTTYQGSDRQDFYRHGRKKINNTEQMPSIFRLGLPYSNPVKSDWVKRPGLQLKMVLDTLQYYAKVLRANFDEFRDISLLFDKFPKALLSWHFQIVWECSSENLNDNSRRVSKFRRMLEACFKVLKTAANFRGWGKYIVQCKIRRPSLPSINPLRKQFYLRQRGIMVSWWYHGNGFCIKCYLQSFVITVLYSCSIMPKVSLYTRKRIQSLNENGLQPLAIIIQKIKRRRFFRQLSERGDNS